MTDSPLVLGIDLGTSGIRTAVVAGNGVLLDSRSQATVETSPTPTAGAKAVGI